MDRDTGNPSSTTAERPNTDKDTTVRPEALGGTAVSLPGEDSVVSGSVARGHADQPSSSDTHGAADPQSPAPPILITFVEGGVKPRWRFLEDDKNLRAHPTKIQQLLDEVEQDAAAVQSLVTKTEERLGKSISPDYPMLHVYHDALAALRETAAATRDPYTGSWSEMKTKIQTRPVKSIYANASVVATVRDIVVVLREIGVAARKSNLGFLRKRKTRKTLEKVVKIIRTSKSTFERALELNTQSEHASLLHRQLEESHFNGLITRESQISHTDALASMAHGLENGRYNIARISDSAPAVTTTQGHQHALIVQHGTPQEPDIPIQNEVKGGTAERVARSDIGPAENAEERAPTALNIGTQQVAGTSLGNTVLAPDLMDILSILNTIQHLGKKSSDVATTTALQVGATLERTARTDTSGSGGLDAVAGSTSQGLLGMLPDLSTVARLIQEHSSGTLPADGQLPWQQLIIGAIGTGFLLSTTASSWTSTCAARKSAKAATKSATAADKNRKIAKKKFRWDREQAAGKQAGRPSSSRARAESHDGWEDSDSSEDGDQGDSHAAKALQCFKRKKRPNVARDTRSAHASSPMARNSIAPASSQRVPLYIPTVEEARQASTQGQERMAGLDNFEEMQGDAATVDVPSTLAGANDLRSGRPNAIPDEVDLADAHRFIGKGKSAVRDPPGPTGQPVRSLERHRQQSDNSFASLSKWEDHEHGLPVSAVAPGIKLGPIVHPRQQPTNADAVAPLMGEPISEVARAFTSTDSSSNVPTRALHFGFSGPRSDSIAPEASGQARPMIVPSHPASTSNRIEDVTDIVGPLDPFQSRMILHVPDVVNNDEDKSSFAIRGIGPGENAGLHEDEITETRNELLEIHPIVDQDGILNASEAPAAHGMPYAEDSDLQRVPTNPLTIKERGYESLPTMTSDSHPVVSTATATMSRTISLNAESASSNSDYSSEVDTEQPKTLHQAAEPSNSQEAFTLEQDPLPA